MTQVNPFGHLPVKQVSKIYYCIMGKKKSVLVVCVCVRARVHMHMHARRNGGRNNLFLTAEQVENEYLILFICFLMSGN